jgi:hypothetical protein
MKQYKRYYFENCAICGNCNGAGLQGYLDYCRACDGTGITPYVQFIIDHKGDPIATSALYTESVKSLRA